MRSSQSLGTAGRQVEFRSESRTASSQTGEGKVSPENLGISSGGIRSNGREELRGSFALEAEGLKRPTTEDKQRGKPVRYVDQSSALGSLLVEREDMQQAYGIKVRPNGVIRAKTLRTSRQSSLTSKSGGSNSRTNVRSTSRASQRSARSQASVASKASGRARSTVGSRRSSSNVPQKNSTGKGKGRGRGSNKGPDNSYNGKAPGSKNGKGHRSSRNPS